MTQVEGVEERTRARAAARARRRAIDPTTRRRAQASIAASLVERLRDHEPGRIATYAATDGEVDPLGAVATLAGLGWRHHLPVLGDGDGTSDDAMSFAPWTPGDPCRANRYRIDEPADRSHPVAAAELDVVVVPCVAVDPAGHRLGFGAGFYDRALSGATDVVLVGVAFEVQLVERIEPHDHDLVLDTVITEQRTIDCR